MTYMEIILVTNRKIMLIEQKVGPFYSLKSFVSFIEKRENNFAIQL